MENTIFVRFVRAIPIIDPFSYIAKHVIYFTRSSYIGIFVEKRWFLLTNFVPLSTAVSAIRT